MTINFNLFTPDKKMSAIRLVIYHKGKTFRKSTGISCNTSDWSVKKQKCSNVKVDEQLKKIRIRLDSVLTEQSNAEYIEKVIDWAISGEGYAPNDKGTIIPFWEYFRQWTERDSNRLYVRKWMYDVSHNILGDKVGWQDIDSVLFFQLQQGLENSDYSLNSQREVIKGFKTVVKEGLKLKYHTNIDYQDVKPQSEEPDTTYLTEDEIRKIEEWRMTCAHKYKPVYRLCADLFLLGVYTAQRKSDVVKMSRSNFVGNKFCLTQQKTGTRVILPLSSKIKAIIDRNNGQMRPVSAYNIYIKKICEIVDISEPFECTKTYGKKTVTFKGPKWQFVGSHTARRTGATMLYKAGVPIKQCMMITGHMTESNFLRYIRITKEENADALAQLDFFK